MHHPGSHSIALETALHPICDRFAIVITQVGVENKSIGTMEPQEDYSPIIKLGQRSTRILATGYKKKSQLKAKQLTVLLPVRVIDLVG